MKPTIRKLLYYLLSVVVIGIAAVIGYYVLPARISYTVTERYTFSGAQNDSSVALGVMLPKSGPYQEVENLNVIWSGEQSTESLTAVDLLKLVGQLHQGELVQAQISYDVRLQVGPAVWDAPVEPFQTQPQAGIESQEAVLVSQAEQIGGRDEVDKAYQIFAYTSEKLSWPTGSRINVTTSALDAYTSEVGGCDEFAHLMTALLRAEGIPSQAISGLAFREMIPLTSVTNTWNHPAGSHAWVEFKAGDQWRMADPSWASYFPNWLYYGRNDGRHLSYGETQAHTEAYNSLQGWAEEQGTLVAAMSAPLKFVASAAGEGVTLTPDVTVKAGWNGRMVNMLALILVTAVPFRIYEEWKKRQKKKEAVMSS